MALHSPRRSTSPLFCFPGWSCHCKGLFIPVWREIHRSKILPVTSWQSTNRTVSDISRRSRHCLCQSFFSRVNLYDSNPFRRNKSTARLCRSARSRSDLMHVSSIRSLLRANERSTCSKSSIYRNMSIDYFPWETLVHQVDGKTYSLSSEASLSICPRLPWVTLRSKQKQQQNENGGSLWKRVVAWVQRGRASTYGIVWSGEWGGGGGWWWLLTPRSAS